LLPIVDEADISSDVLNTPENKQALIDETFIDFWKK
jgi:hypothetical protein